MESSLNLIFNIVGTILNTIIAVLVLYLTYLAVKFTAKPKIRVTFVNSNNKREIKQLPGCFCVIRLYIENVGHWFSAKPAASNIQAWINLPSLFKLVYLRYGANLDKVDFKEKSAKGGIKYLRADEITLFHEEPGEYLELGLITPKKEGEYELFIPIYANEGHCGFSILPILIGQPDYYFKDYSYKQLEEQLCKDINEENDAEGIICDVLHFLRKNWEKFNLLSFHIDTEKTNKIFIGKRQEICISLTMPHDI